MFHLHFAVSPDQRVSLMYVCNEVIQTCARKHASQYKRLWHLCLKDAMVLCRSVAPAHSIHLAFHLITILLSPLPTLR